MKVSHTYCDICKRQMDWQSGSQNIVNGFEIEGELTISARVKNECGHSAWQAARVKVEHVCSGECMMTLIARLSKAVQEKNVPPLAPEDQAP